MRQKDVLDNAFFDSHPLCPVTVHHAQELRNSRIDVDILEACPDNPGRTARGPLEGRADLRCGPSPGLAPTKEPSDAFFASRVSGGVGAFAKLVGARDWPTRISRR